MINVKLQHTNETKTFVRHHFTTIIIKWFKKVPTLNTKASQNLSFYSYKVWHHVLFRAPKILLRLKNKVIILFIVKLILACSLAHMNLSVKLIHSKSSVFSTLGLRLMVTYLFFLSYSWSTFIVNKRSRKLTSELWEKNKMSKKVFKLRIYLLLNSRWIVFCRTSH